MDCNREAGTRAVSRLGVRVHDFDELLDAIKRRGFRLVGPMVRDGAICYDDLSSAKDLPEGWTDEQDAARYRLKKRDDDALFGYNVGPHSWKKYLFPPYARLSPPDKPFAFIGVRSCELTAIAIQDRVFLGGQHKDQHYESRRQDGLIVAVNCGEAGGTCFCASMDAGPRATRGFDVALTELLGGNGHRFLAEAGTARGAEILAEVRTRPAHADDIGAANASTENAVASMGRVICSTRRASAKSPSRSAVIPWTTGTCCTRSATSVPSPRRCAIPVDGRDRPHRSQE
jgi:hypothetical protein